MPKSLVPREGECPHCGGTSGMYRFGRARGQYQYNYNFDGRGGDNTHLHDSLFYNENKKCFCLDCNKSLPKSYTERIEKYNP